MTDTQVAHVYLETMLNSKTYVFTVADVKNAGKPIVYAQHATSKMLHDQAKVEQLLGNWALNNISNVNELKQFQDDLEDLTYNMRKNGYAWFNEQYCFELTEVYG